MTRTVAMDLTRRIANTTQRCRKMRQSMTRSISAVFLVKTARSRGSAATMKSVFQWTGTATGTEIARMDRTNWIALVCRILLLPWFRSLIHLIMFPATNSSTNLTEVESVCGGENKFFCYKSNQCIFDSYVCDGDPDCSEGE